MRVLVIEVSLLLIKFYDWIVIFLNEYLNSLVYPISNSPIKKVFPLFISYNVRTTGKTF